MSGEFRIMMRNSDYARGSGRLYRIMALVLAALYAVMYAVTPLCFDDLWYTKDSTGAFGSWEYFRTTVATAYAHWQWDVGRVCNMVAAPFLSVLPKWVYGIVTGGWIYLIYVLGIRIARVRYDSLASAFWMATVSFIIPWYDSFFTIIYSINYIWGAGLGLITVYLFLRADEEPQSTGVIKSALLIILGIATGWWHEGVSVSLIISFTIFKIAERRWPSRGQWLLIGGVACGIVILMSMPAFHSQGVRRESHLIKSVGWETLMNLASYCLGYVYIILMIITLSISRLRNKLFGSLKSLATQSALLTFCVVTFVLFFRYYNGPRTAMFGQLAAAFGIIGITKGWLKRPHPRAGRIILTAVGIFAVVSLVAAIKMQLVLTREITEVHALAAEAEKRTGRLTVFYDPTPIKIGIDLLKPTYMVLNTEYGLRGIQLFPAELKDFHLSEPTLTYNRDSTLIIYKNRLLMHGQLQVERPDIILVYEGGAEELSRLRVREFVTAEGDTVSFILPHTQAIGSQRTIQDARLVVPGEDF